MRLFTTGQVAQVLGVSTTYVQDRCRKGTIKHLFVPGSTHRRILRDEVVRLVEEHGYSDDHLREWENTKGRIRKC